MYVTVLYLHHALVSTLHYHAPFYTTPNPHTLPFLLSFTTLYPSVYLLPHHTFTLLYHTLPSFLTSFAVPTYSPCHVITTKHPFLGIAYHL